MDRPMKMISSERRTGLFLSTSQLGGADYELVEQQPLQLPRTMVVSVFGQQTTACTVPDATGGLGRELRQQPDHIFTAAHPEHFTPGFQKIFEPVPGIADQAGTGSARLEHSGRW